MGESGIDTGSGRYSIHWLNIKLISARLHAASRLTTRCLALLPRPPQQMTVPEHKEEADEDEEISLTDIKMQISWQREGDRETLTDCLTVCNALKIVCFVAQFTLN